MTRADRDAEAILSANQSRADEQRWTMGVQLVLDWSEPLEALRPLYSQAALLAVLPLVPVWDRLAKARDPLEG